MDTNKGEAQKQRGIFARNFKQILMLKGKTQADVSNDLGITSSTVSDWANAKKYPRVDKMQALADYLGVFLSDLRDEKPAPTNGDELLSPEEIEYLKVFRAASPERKKAMLLLLGDGK